MPQEGREPGWPQGSRKLGRARDRSSFYLEVYQLDIVPCGIMAQIAQKRLYFSFAASASQENDVNDVYLDIPAALTAVNRKQYHQFTAKGDPLCYTVTVTGLITDRELKFCTAPNTWTTRNAAKKTAAGWMEQMKNSNIRMSELPTYARRFRCARGS